MLSLYDLDDDDDGDNDDGDDDGGDDMHVKTTTALIAEPSVKKVT